MIKIKICGLTRPCDIEIVNEGNPDFCGFVIDVPQSRRNLSPDKVRLLRTNLHESIFPVGVFVNAPPEEVASLLNDKTICAAQLHGTENYAYIKKLKALTDAPVIQAFSISAREDVIKANLSAADYILLDHGTGGSGRVFDWSLTALSKRPFLLAGGLTPENIGDAIHEVSPWAIDLSSGVETDGYKNKDKVLAAIAAVRKG